MAAYDLEEQEQLSAMKAWWDKYGNLITTAATVVLVVLAAWLGWTRYQSYQGQKATAVYAELFRAAESGEQAKLDLAAKQLTSDYPNELQASLGTLMAARVDVDHKDTKNARVKLSWVIEHGKDDLLKDMARLRLAALMLDEKVYGDAIKTIDGGVTTEFAARFADLRGDVLVEQGKLDAARAAYKQAAEKYGDGNSLKSMVETKLEALGGS